MSITTSIPHVSFKKTKIRMQMVYKGRIIKEFITVPDLLNTDLTDEEIKTFMRLKLRRKFKDHNGGSGTNNIEDIRTAIEKEHEV